MTLAYAPSRNIAAKLRRRHTQWRAAQPAVLRFETPLLSIAFDDFPASAAQAGAAVLEAAGARATYYAAASLADRSGPCGRNFAPADIARLVAAGHEIGCHGYFHLDAAQQDVFDVLHDMALNREALMAMGAPSPHAHAYPYGETTMRLKIVLPPRLRSARGILPGLNVGQRDLAQLRAFPMYGPSWSKRLERALERAARRRAWIVAFTHDLADAPSSFGTRGADLEALIERARALGFEILPVSAALDRRLA